MEKTALIINGAEIRKPEASGRLNTLLFETIQEELRDSYKVITTIIQKGYDVLSEQQKFLEANLIIFQTPVFWFSIPSSFKRYIDDVYTYGKFFGPATQYGRGGLLANKTYMLSSTWNAKSTDFNSASGFFGERDSDAVLLAFHLTQHYVGLQQIPTFSVYDAVHSPEAEASAIRLRQHLFAQGIKRKHSSISS